jgi:hypothetical protein
MFVALWEYEVKPGCEQRFEKAYGPDGDWVRLFRSDLDYRETRLLHDPSRTATYLTLDFWNSPQAYEKFLVEHCAEYKTLDDATEGLTANERRIGWYEIVAP